MIKNSQQDLVITSRCQKLLERIPQLAWVMNEPGELIYFNQRWCEYSGRLKNQDDIVRFDTLLHVEDRLRFLRAWEGAKQAPGSLKIKLRLADSLDEWEWFQIELEPDRDEWGQTSWIGTAVGCGGEGALPDGLRPSVGHQQQQSARFLEALLAHASDGIVACDTNGHLVLFNRMAQIFHGLPPEPIDPDQWSHYYDLYDADGIRLLAKSEIPLFRALQGESVISQEMMIKSAAGGNRSLLASGMAIYSPSGEKLGAVALMRDITAYKQAEIERIRVQFYSERLSIAMKVAGAAAWNWDLSNQKLFWTPEFEILFDYEPGTTEQLYGEWANRLHPDDRDQVEAKLQETINLQKSEFRYEYRIVWRDGQVRWIESVGELHSDSQSNVQWLSGLVYDITDRKQAEIDLQYLNHTLISTQADLKERNTELDRFCYIVSHDLKAPLRGIANLSAWIEEDFDTQNAEETKVQLQQLRQRVIRMNALVDGLLDYSQLGRKAIEIEPVDVAEILPSIIDSLNPPANFTIAVLSPLPILQTKRILLIQVLTNLLSNAIKHHPASEPTAGGQLKGQIEIDVQDQDDCVQFSISDNGPGIPEGPDRERIFQIFQTLDSTRSTENTGIGLAIVKKIVEDEGGQIWLDPDHTPGARFCFTWSKATASGQLLS
jgi:PAS domain S-box-containing protein